MRKPILLSVCIMAVMAGCSGKQAGEADLEAKPSVELIVVTPPLLYGKLGGGDLNSAAYTDFLEYAAEKFTACYGEADVHIQVKGFDYLEEKSAVQENFDTPQAVDVLLEGFFNMSQYIHTGRLAVLDDIVTDEIRADISEEMWEEGIYQENIYMYPFYHLPNTMTLMRNCSARQGWNVT